MDTQALEDAAWSAAYGIADAQQVALLESDRGSWQRSLERILDETEERLTAVRTLPGPERDQVVADLEGIQEQLQEALDSLTGVRNGDGAGHDGGDGPGASPAPALAAAAAPGATPGPPLVADPAGEVRLQATWADGRVVVWAAGPGTPPADDDAVSDLLEAVGGPPHGWNVHPPVALPGGVKAQAISIGIADALGWLVTLGGGDAGRELANGDVGSSLRWLGRVVIAAVRTTARGRVVPTLNHARRPGGRTLGLEVEWAPALIDSAELAELASAMPRPVGLLTPAQPRTLALSVMNAAVDAILREAARKVEVAAPPPTVRTAADVTEAVITRLDGSPFEAPVGVGTSAAKRLQSWVKPVSGVAATKLVVQLEAPDRGNAWFLSVLGPGADGTLLPVEVALADSRDTSAVATELARLERILPELLRAGGSRRGQVYLSDAEAWKFMTETGASIEAAGFDVRVPALSRKKPTPALRLFTMPAGETVVGANQLSDVRWSVVFDDVELTAADVARLAAQARPLVESRGRWVELDRVDLAEAAAALAERASTTQLTGAEILRHAVGLEGPQLAGGLTVEGTSWATDLLHKAQGISVAPVTEPEGFVGELRSYQAEALAWLRFLDAVGLGGCLALDMGLGKTPTVLAHVASSEKAGPALVIAPPAVVGNWAAEAERFTPSLRVVIHHGTSRASAEALEAEVAGADLVVTTYGTAVRDVEALSGLEWDRVVLDEAQAVKNPANETAQQLRRIRARTRIALTGTPIENGLGDLWAILDFTNPGLVGPRPAFIAQLSGDGEAALRALNGVLVFRRTKSEPVVAKELPDRIDELDHCTMTPEQIGLYQAVLDRLVDGSTGADGNAKKGAILAAITALKQICNHPAAYQDDTGPLAGRSGKLARLEEIVDSVFAAGERILVFTHFAEWGKKMADHLTERTGIPIACYHGGLARGPRDRLVAEFQQGTGPGALVLSLKAGGTGLNLTAASHVVLYDRWWNPAVEDQARDRAWRIGQTRTVVSHRLVCPGTVDERVEEVVAGKRHVADLVLPKSSSLADLDADQLRIALGLRPASLLTEEDT
jgi:hypothetical protein